LIVDRKEIGMLTPDKFREYAKECERIAKTLAPLKRGQLLEMARAWIACAEEEERRRHSQKERGG
jgi:hypothetical protein